MILIFGGTTEGRMAVRVADDAGKPFYYSTLGAEQEIVSLHGVRITGGMDVGQMKSWCLEHDIRLLVDAAHPFAVRLHENIASCASMLSLPVIRCERTYAPHADDIVYCRNYADAIEKLEESGITRLLALTGVKTISKLKPYWEHHGDTYFRILNRQSSLDIAEACGFPRDYLLYYETGGSEEDVCRRISPDAVLTKESGASGGFDAKIEAARRLGIRIFVVERPVLPSSFIKVTGEFGLRKEIERLLPDFYDLRSGFTTGACATAASKAALLALLDGKVRRHVSFTIPDGEVLSMPVQETEIMDRTTAIATVKKDAGDDPDVTNGCEIRVKVSFAAHSGIRFYGGEGVGRITLPGLGIPVGEPAINRVPREMMTRELSAFYAGGLDVEISIPQGKELAKHTFNPRLGIVDGISIIGTSGVVRPFSNEAFVDAIRRQIEVCKAIGSPRLVINSGAKSEEAVKRKYACLPPQAFVHYGNFIGETLKISVELDIPHVTLGLMIGKAVKLAEGHLDTHSHKVTMNKSFLKQVARDAGCSDRTTDIIEQMTMARELWTLLDETDRSKFIACIMDCCRRVCGSVFSRLDRLEILLIDEEGTIYD